MEGGGRTWSVVHSGSLEQFRHRSSRAAVRSSSRATPRSKRSSWRAPAAAASRRRRPSHALAHRRNAVGELAADAHRGRSASGLGIVAGSGALTFFDADATKAFWILIVMHGIFWFSLEAQRRPVHGRVQARLSALSSLHPSAPHDYVRRRRHGYDAISCTALYVVSAALLGFAFGQPLPLFSVTVLLVAAHFGYPCIQWSTRNRVVQWVGSIVFFLPFLSAQNRVTSPCRSSSRSSRTQLMVLLGVVTFGLTVAGVARQRRGDAIGSAPRTAGSGGYPDWLVNLFRFPCPTSSATRAQVWFELRSSGLPVLTIGFASRC